GYLVLGYYFTATKEYDITWTMPHCILALRLIGLVFDVYDGMKDPETLPHDQKRTALRGLPSLLEVMGHSYFFGGFLVGPQFPMKRYLDFVQGTFFSKKGEKPSCVVPALLRMGLGLLCLLFSQLGSLWFDEKYMLSDQYMTHNLAERFVLMGVWQVVTLHKYVACWLLAEGSCIMAGLTYNGKDENGNDLWNGCVNIDVWKYETTTTFDGLIKSFNINTNLWVAQYVFKRLRFLGNKQLSQLLALLFLAFWHGLHSGYYLCFFNEFIVMKFEKDAVEVIERVDWLKRLVYHRYLRVPRFLVLKLFVLCMFGYCIVPFTLLSYERYTQAYSRVYWLGHILYLGWFPLAPLVFKALPKKPKDKAQ
ncbi:unnamed protein product, partial [Ixodes hexagonus]